MKRPAPTKQRNHVALALYATGKFRPAVIKDKRRKERDRPKHQLHREANA